MADPHPHPHSCDQTHHRWHLILCSSWPITRATRMRLNCWTLNNAAGVLDFQPLSPTSKASWRLEATASHICQLEFTWISDETVSPEQATRATWGKIVLKAFNHAALCHREPTEAYLSESCFLSRAGESNPWEPPCPVQVLIFLFYFYSSWFRVALKLHWSQQQSLIAVMV